MVCPHIAIDGDSFSSFGIVVNGVAVNSSNEIVDAQVVAQKKMITTIKDMLRYELAFCLFKFMEILTLFE